MDATPIYTELQQTLVDPEADNWSPSAPPEFAEALTEGADRPAQESKKDPPKTGDRRSGKRGGRRHRAEE